MNREMPIAGRSFRFTRGLLTLDPFEGHQIISRLGGSCSPSPTSVTDYLVVTDSIAASDEAPKKYMLDAIEKGSTLLGESDFWRLAGIERQPEGIADRWVVVDDYLENGKVDVSNAPAWDGSIAPYKLFLQHGTQKTTGDGGWKVVACGELSTVGYSAPNVGGKGNNSWSDCSIPEGAAPWAQWRNDIGTVVVGDRYSPSSCLYLFDGLNRCSSFNLTMMDTSNATTLRGMFRGCSSVDYFMSTDRFSTSNVEDMSEMFSGCINARVINCIGWDLSKVTSMSMMFANSPAAVLFDSSNVPLPERIDTSMMFDSAPKGGQWLRRA